MAEKNDVPTRHDVRLAEEFHAGLRRVIRDAHAELKELENWADLVSETIQGKDGADLRVLFEDFNLIRTEEVVGEVLYVHKGSTRGANARMLERTILKMAHRAGALEGEGK